MMLGNRNFSVFFWNIRQFLFGFLIGFFICLIFTSDCLSFNKSETFTSFNITRSYNQEFSIGKNFSLGSDQFFKKIINFYDKKNKCDYGPKGPRILCAVFTYEKNHKTKAVSVDKTWGKRCDKTIFLTNFASETIPELNSTDQGPNFVNLNKTSDYSKLTIKTIETLLYVYKNLIDEFDWVLKADDDTFVIVENLRYFLSQKCPDELKTYGFKYEPRSPERFTYEFNSGGAGYLISNKSVRLFAEEYLNNLTFCRDITGAEDADIARCLYKLGVTPGDSRDKKGRERFHPLSFQEMWSLPSDHWTFKYSKYPIKRVSQCILFKSIIGKIFKKKFILKGEECCSNSTISFHYTSNEKMLQLDYLLYNLKHKSYVPFSDDYILDN